MSAVYRTILTGLIAGIIALAGCGGGSGSGTNVAGIGGTGRTISGTITGFGSIFVNDVEYDIDNASFDINDDSSPGLSEDDLSIGMVVTLTGNDDGTVGVASQVVYDNEIKGPVSGLADVPGFAGVKQSFSVFGVDVVVDVAGTTFDDSSAPGFSFATLAEGDIVELSGLFDSSNTLVASYIEKTDDLDPGSSEVELKGTPDAGTDAGIDDNFILNGVTVNIVAGTDLSDIPGSRVTDTQFIEVKGTLINTNTIEATRIEQEDEGIDPDDGEVSLEGFISDFTDNSSFMVSGQQVNATDATFEPAGLTLRNDLRVEVEGRIVNGILIAEKVEQED